MDDFDKRFLKKVFKIFCTLFIIILSLVLFGWGMITLFGENAGLFISYGVIVLIYICYDDGGCMKVLYNTITEYRTEWEDCCMLICCPYCDSELYLDSQNEPKQCSCGHVFYLSTNVIEVIKNDI